MKKLIIVFAITAIAVVGNAATVNWGSSAMTLPSGNNAGSSVSAALYIVSQSVYDTYSAYTDATKLSNAIYTEYKNQSAKFTGTSKKSAVTLSDGVEYSSGNTVYAVLLYTATEDGTAYWMGNYGKATLESSQNLPITQMGQYLGGSTGTGTIATAWSSNVPEPTSAMLLFLGFAGLLLKRKNA